MSLTDHVAVVIENALLFREVAQQKAFAETLLGALPIGVIAVAGDGRIDWFNDAAERILRLTDLAEYKRRQAAPGVKITRRNFGRDRRYPITNAFRDGR